MLALTSNPFRRVTIFLQQIRLSDYHTANPQLTSQIHWPYHTKLIDTLATRRITRGLEGKSSVIRDQLHRPAGLNSYYDIISGRCYATVCMSTRIAPRLS